MKRILFAVLSAFLCVICVYAQEPELPLQCKAWLPNALNQDVLKEMDVKRIMKLKDYGMKEKKTNRYWIVYSDRANNPTYVSPSTSAATYKTLHFNQTVRVADVKNGYALVYEDPMYETYPKISPRAECLGWVPMDKMLMWPSCLADQYGIMQKALLCTDLDKVKNSSVIGRGSYDPNVRGTVEVSSDMNFYYVMKRENGMTLLAKQSKLDGAYVDDVLYCWIPDNIYVPWNQRSCLEPTWDHSDVDFFLANDVSIPIYAKPNLTERKGTIHFSRKDTYKKRTEMYLHRKDGNSLRYPILDETTDDVYSLSSFVSMGDQEGNVDLDEQSAAAADQATTLEKLQTVNVGFVIDGTSSMEEYYPAVKEAIKKGCRYYDQQMDVRIGVVIYRDYTEGEKGLVEVLPLTSIKNAGRINSFLDSGGNYGIKSSKNDYTETEALYYGLNTALDKLRFESGNSNMLIVVGDCGNAEDDKKCVSSSVLQNKLIEKNISFFAFQVRNKSRAAYNSFNKQMLMLARKSLNGIYHRMNNQSIALPVRMFNDQDIQIGYDFDANTSSDLYVSRCRNADVKINNGIMDIGELTTIIEDAFADLAARIKERSEIVVNAPDILRGKQGVVQDEVQIEQSYLMQMLNESTIDAMRKANSLISFRGYAPKVYVDPRTGEKVDRELFKVVVFMSRDEYINLRDNMSPVFEAVRIGGNVRENYIYAMRSLVGKLAPGKTDAEIMQMKPSVITQMIVGLNEAPKVLRDHTLLELADEHAVSPQEFDTIIRDFMNRYKGFELIGENPNYRFQKKFNNDTYYWIPMDAIP